LNRIKISALKGRYKNSAENIREKINGKIPLRIFPFFLFRPFRALIFWQSHPRATRSFGTLALGSAYYTPLAC
jgi:hypothetical protein